MYVGIWLYNMATANFFFSKLCSQSSWVQVWGKSFSKLVDASLRPPLREIDFDPRRCLEMAIFGVRVVILHFHPFLSGTTVTIQVFEKTVADWHLDDFLGAGVLGFTST